LRNGKRRRKVSYPRVVTFNGNSGIPDAIPWLEKIPLTNESSYMLGYAYQQVGRSKESVQAFARLFGVNPESAGAYLLTGQMLIKKQLDNAGLEQGKRALALDPKLPEAHYLLGEIAMFHGLLTEC
jgi:tetratricopeptide (TPR) repeat protein